MADKPKAGADKPKRKYERDTPTSLAPLDFMQALRALLKTPPPEKPAGSRKPASKPGR